MVIDDMLNCWLIKESTDNRFSKHFPIGAHLILNATKATKCLEHTDADCQIIIVGCCVDAHGEYAPEAVAKFLGEKDFGDFIRETCRLAGSYVIVRRQGENFCIVGDATHMMSVFYSTKSACVAAYEFLVAESVGAVKSKESAEVIKCDYDSNLTLAGELTVYENVKCLLANHYLELGNMMASRYFPFCKLQVADNEPEMRAIVKRTLDYARNIVVEYSKLYNFICPLTSGYDSRVITAIARKFMEPSKVEYFTTRTKRLTDSSPDLCVAKEIATDLKLNYRQISHMTAPTDRKKFLQEAIDGTRVVLGNFEWTCANLFPQKAMFNGQLIGQIGKSSVGNDLPEFCATIGFLQTKQRNTSSVARRETARWYKDARHFANGYSLFDLHGWEFRCGRWNSNSVSSSAASGLLHLNIFNCTELLAEWCRIPRAKRFRKKFIHTVMLEELEPRLLLYPFNPDERIGEFFRGLPPIFWLASYAKYYCAAWRNRQVNSGVKR